MLSISPHKHSYYFPVTLVTPGYQAPSTLLNKLSHEKRKGFLKTFLDNNTMREKNYCPARLDPAGCGKQTQQLCQEGSDLAPT